MPFPAGYLTRSPRAVRKLTGPPPSAAGNGAIDDRAALLDRMVAFVIRHDLAVTAPNMAIICGALSGSHPELASAFCQREAADAPIDQRWLDTLAWCDPHAHAQRAAFETLCDTLEYTLVRFAVTAREAHTHTSDQRGAIGEQIALLAGPEGLVHVLELSRAMLARIEQVETAMARSQSEIERLRASLAHARSEAEVDHLTGLPNRRAFERALEAATRRAQDEGEPLSLGFCDIDHFKRINDRHGHAAGDRVLCALAARFAEAAGDGCFVARHGGEEFVLLFPGLTKQAARDALEQIRRVQAARVLMNRETGVPYGKITFSAGLAEVTEDADPRSALARADAALYRAKQKGRNRVELG